MAKMTELELENYRSHHLGIVDDCVRCYNCEIGSWNAHKAFCS